MADGRRVLIIVENLPVPFDRRVWLEATTLQRSGYEVSVICPQGAGCEAPYECVEGVHVYRHPLAEATSAPGYAREYLSALAWEYRLARRVWRERGFDVVHICNPPDLLFAVAAWFKLVRGVRIIFDQHDLVPEVYEVKFGRRDWLYHVLRWAERLTFAVADAVIATNESYREVALRRGRKSPHDVFVVRSGPDLSRLRATPPNAAYRRGRAHLVGYVGVMGKQDGVDYLIRAADHVVRVRGRRDVQFMLIGGGPAFADATRLAAELGLGENVEFTGKISWLEREFAERLSTCDVCVSPDPKDPFNDRSTMNKVLEYMALAKPVVQFDLVEGRRSAEGAALYARPNDAGDLGDRIVELLDAPERRARMGQLGRSRVEHVLAWRHQEPQLLRAYEAAVRPGARR